MLDPYPWQAKAWRFLVSEAHQNRLPHALLLHGESGLGKRDLASAFATFILCDQQAGQSKACGECQSCRWFSAGSHPDFFRVTLEEGARNIKVDQLRELRTKLETTSQRGGYQVAIVEFADTMNRAAANAFLKTLEEPPGNILILLVADRLSALPATIISRCQYVGFCASQNQETLSWLRQKISGDVDVERLFKLADYAPLRALKFLENNYFELRNEILLHFSHILSGETDPVSRVPEFLKQPLDFLLIILMSLISDVIRLQHAIDPVLLAHSDQLEKLRYLAKSFDSQALHQYFQQCQSALASAQSGTAFNAQLLLENVFVSIPLTKNSSSRTEGRSNVR